MTPHRCFFSLFALLLASALLTTTARAERVRGEGFGIEVPDDWERQQGVMGTSLIARPARSVDAEGWSADLLTITREPADRRRTCLEAFTQRKLGQIAHGTERFAKLDELPLEFAGKQGGVATLLTLRYEQGPRDLMAYVLILDAGSHFLTATLTSSPARFEFQRANFRRIVESLRRASAPAKPR